jgi:hypothetical protein
MPQGSVIGNYHEIELVRPDVRASSLFVLVNLVLSDPSMCCLAARHADWNVKMACFDYGAAAELFPSRQRTRAMGAVTYMRFAAAAEAIRYAVEEIPANSLRGAFLEVNEERFDSNEIRRLYESVEYPLPRQPAAIRDRLLSVRRAS